MLSTRVGSGDFKDLPRRTASDKVLCDNAFNIAKNQKHDGYQRHLASMVYQFFDKKLVLINQLSENLKTDKYTHLLLTIFGVLILLICN